MDISIARDGQVIDQVTLEEAAARLKDGSLLPTDHYWQAGMSAWRLLPQLFATQVTLPFVRPATGAPTLLDRMLGRRSESECLALYWDLLAAAPDHGAVPAADLDALDVTCGCAVRRRCREALGGWYDAYVASALADGKVVDAERAVLTRVAVAFGIPADCAASALKAAVLRHYGEQMPLLLRAEQPTRAAVESVRRLEASLGLPAGEVAALRAPHLAAHLAFLLGGDEPSASVTPLVARAIRALAESFAFDLGANGLAARLARCEANWQAEHGPLPVVDADIFLASGEICHWAARSELQQLKRVTVGLSYGGPVASIRIMKGLSWRMASYRGARETAIQLVSLGEGTLYITNRRVVFNGDLKSLNIKLERVIDIHGYKDSLKLDMPTGISPYFMINGDTVVPFRILERVCQAAQGN